jgi:hypothetical protein
MRPIVQRYGAEAVEWVGLEALGYPPKWVLRVTEATAVVAAIQKTEGEDDE